MGRNGIPCLLCQDLAMPNRPGLLEDKHPVGQDLYARGRECGLGVMAGELLEQAEQSLLQLRDGRIDSGRIQQQRLPLDARR